MHEVRGKESKVGGAGSGPSTPLRESGVLRLPGQDLLTTVTGICAATSRGDVLENALSAIQGGLGSAADVRWCGPTDSFTPGAWRLPLDQGHVEITHATGETTPPAWIAQLMQLARLRCDELSEHAQLTESVKRLADAERLQRALYSIADLASSDEDLDEVYPALHRIIASLMYAENFFIALCDEERNVVRFPYFADTVDEDIPEPDEELAFSEISESLSGYVMRSGRPLMGPSRELAQQASLRAATDFGPESIDWLGVPLLFGSRVGGALVVQSYTERARYSEDDLALLVYVAQHVATALDRKRAHEELELRVTERTNLLRAANRELQMEVLERQRGERLQAALFRIAELANTTDGLDAFYRAVHGVVSDLLYARNFYIALIAESRDELLFPYQVDEFDPNRRSRKFGRGLTEYVLRCSQPVLADRATIERLQREGEVISSGTESVCWLGVPLVCEDAPVGVLAVQSYHADHVYTPRDQELLTFVSYHIANALDRKRSAESLKAAYVDLEQRVAERTIELYEANRDLRAQIGERERIERQLKHETLHDALTGLPNRAHFMDRLGQTLKRYTRDTNRQFAVLFLDLDRFKVINDSVGHLIGDDLLKEASARIAECLRGHDLVARLGGDEFAVLVDDIRTRDEALFVATRIVQALDASFMLGGKEIFTSVSIGVTLCAPRYSKPEELLRDADAAMYRAKAEGRRRVEFFDESLHHKALALLELENDIRRALANEEFVPFYQPIVRLSDGKVQGFEALVRWRHPQRGLVMPAEFLSVAEENGLIDAIDWRVLALVCAQLALWSNRLPEAELPFVSVNFSGHHFRSMRFTSEIGRIVDDSRAPASHLRLEVTERALLESPDTVNESLEYLRRLGVRVSLDDFGTGYSSLSYLHQYPLDTLKIDQSFVRDLRPGGASGGHAIVRAIRTLAEALGMGVVAEGIETELQRDALIEIGCELGQGYLYSPACDAESAFALLTRD